MLFCAVAVKLRVEVDRGVYCFRVRAALAKLQKGRIHLIFIQLRLESLNHAKLSKTTKEFLLFRKLLMTLSSRGTTF